MKIAIIGTGYVGLVAGTCFAETGNDVICMDIDKKRITSLGKGKVPLYEPGLEELIRRNVGQGRLRFTTHLAWAVKNSFLVFIAVGTPAGDDGSSDLCHVLAAAHEIARAMNGYKIIVTRSTVPVGTADRLKREIAERTRYDLDIVSNPEFLKEGAAVDDFLKPDRVVIGTDQASVAEIMKDLYAPLTRTGAPILVMDPRSAEMTKYAANAMLASRISLMNEIANLCERVGADMHWVRQGVGFDRRIGPSFLFPGVGYGGSCFPKDVRALVSLGREQGYAMPMVEAVEEVNNRQKVVLVEKLLDFYGKSVKGKTFALWGLSFKPQTDDMREAPSKVMMERLLEWGAKIQAYDPEAARTAGQVFGKRIRYAGTNCSLEGSRCPDSGHGVEYFPPPRFPAHQKALEAAGHFRRPKSIRPARAARDGLHLHLHRPPFGSQIVTAKGTFWSRRTERRHIQVLL